MRILGSTPGRIAIGVLHNGPRSHSSEPVERKDIRELTIWCHAIEFRFVIVLAAVGFNFEVFLTERLVAVLAFERQEINEAAKRL